MAREEARTSVGLVKCPGEEPQTFVFVSSDDDSTLKSGEFVTYDAVVEGKPREILAHIVERQPLRVYPDGFLLDPDLGPATVAAVMGYSGDRAESFAVTAKIVGYLDEALRDFVNPRIPPRAGSRVYLAGDQLLSQLLSRRKPGEIGAVSIGSLLSRPGGRVPIRLDLGAIVSTHLAIIANTGSGKSYTAGVLIEEMMRSNNRAAVLVIDPHGEYGTLEEMTQCEQLAGENYKPVVEIYEPGDVKVRVGSLSMGDLRHLLPGLSDRMEYVLKKAFDKAQQWSRKEREDSTRWTLEQLRKALREIGKLKDPDDEEEEGQENEKGGKYKDTAGALVWRINSVLDDRQLVRVFDDEEQINLRSLLKPGKCSVLQLQEVDDRQQQVLVAVLLRRLFDARIRTMKGQATEKEMSDFYLPYPVFVLVEEAHNFAPANGDAVSSPVIKKILAEGRKFGFGMGLISQRPGKLDADALSQCNTQFLLRLVNPLDQDTVRKGVESVGQDILRELPALSKGQAILAGTAVSTPVLCQVRKRWTKHGAEDIPAPEAWMNYFSSGEQEDEKRSTVLVAGPRRPARR
jgi:DNA helicase HerA-like ATPase